VFYYRSSLSLRPVKLAGWQILNLHRFGTFFTYQLPINEVINYISQAGKCPKPVMIQLSLPGADGSGDGVLAKERKEEG